jgi:hypothetical protein
MSNQQGQGEKTKGVVDLVFLIDATGSMGTCIEALKRNIEMFIVRLQASDANNGCIVKDWRGKVVGYRDFGTDIVPFVDNPFVREAADLKQQLAALRADGGGDAPESLLDAIYKVATMGDTPKGGQENPRTWRYRSDAARVVIVFTDAPYHPKMSIPEAKDGDLQDVINVCHENRIILSIFAPDMPCYDDLSSIDKAEYEPVGSADDNPQGALAQFTADEQNFRRTLEMLARSVSKSASTPSL